MKALALAVLLALPDAGVQHDAPRIGYAPAAATLHLADGGVIEVTRGCWFDSNTCVATARERIELKERAERAEAQDVKTPAPDLLRAFGAGALVGALVAIAVAVALAPYVNPAQPSP